MVEFESRVLVFKIRVRSWDFTWAMQWLSSFHKHCHCHVVAVHLFFSVMDWNTLTQPKN